MKLSLQYYSLVPLLRAGKITTEEIIKFAKREGFEAMEYLLFDPTQQIDNLKLMLKEYNIKISCVDFFVDLAAQNEDAYEKQIQIAKLAIDKAAELSAKMVMVIPAYEESVIDKETAKQSIIKGLNRIVDYGIQKEIRVTIEDYPSLKIPLCSITEIQDILEKIPQLKLTFDTGNFMLAGDNTLEAYERLYPYVINVHAKDWKSSANEDGTETINGEKLVPGIHGDGLVELKELFKKLHDNKYGGYIGLEYEGELDNLEPILECKKYIDKLLIECKEE